MYRFHPQTRAVLELIADGAVGEVQHVDASFSFRAGERTGRLFDPATAGGGILDVGGYPVSYARAILGAASGRASAGADRGHRARHPRSDRDRRVGGCRSHLPRRRHGECADGRQDGRPHHGHRARLARHPAPERSLDARHRAADRDQHRRRRAGGRVQRRPAVRAGSRRAGSRRGGRRSGERDEPGRLARQRRRAGHLARADRAALPVRGRRQRDPDRLRSTAAGPRRRRDAVREDRRPRPPGVPTGDGLRQPADPGPRLGDVRPLLRRRRQHLRHRLHLRRRAAGATARSLDRQPRSP